MFFFAWREKISLDGVPVVLVLASVLAVVDGGDLEDAEGALAGAADRRAAALVQLFARGGGGAGLLGLGERGRGDGAQGQEGHERSGGRHFDVCVWVVVLEKVVERWSRVGERLDVAGFL